MRTYFIHPVKHRLLPASTTGCPFLQAAVNTCARGSGNDTTIMTSIAICLNYQFGPANVTNTRGILCTPSASTGSGLALSLRGSQVYQQTVDTQYYGNPDGGIPWVNGWIGTGQVTCAILLF